MGSQFAPDPPTVGGRTPLQSRDQFVEICVAALCRLDLVRMFKHPPRVTTFLDAYVLARCIPIIMNSGAMLPPNWDPDDFGEELAKLARIGERFLNAWSPTSTMEAALMMDLFNATEDWPDDLSQVPVRVEEWLLQEHFAGDEMALAASMLLEMTTPQVTQ